MPVRRYTSAEYQEVSSSAVNSPWRKRLSGKERYAFALGTCAGTALLAVLLVGKLAPAEYVGLAWSILAVVVLELGSNGLPFELRGCFGPLALIAAEAIVATHLDDFAKFPAPSVYLTYFGARLCAIAATIRLTLLPAENRWERTMLRDAIATLACLADLAGIWLVTPDAAVTSLRTGVALAVVEIGVALEDLRSATSGSLLSRRYTHGFSCSIWIIPRWPTFRSPSPAFTGSGLGFRVLRSGRGSSSGRRFSRWCF